MDTVLVHDLTEITEFLSRHDDQSEAMDCAFEERIGPRDTQQCAFDMEITERKVSVIKSLQVLLDLRLVNV
jgi:hypothetical protein